MTEQAQARGTTQPLADDVIRQELQGLPNWLHDVEAGTLVREYQFQDAAHADRFLSWLTQLSTDFGYRPVVDREDAEVCITLSTDSSVTHRDLEFAHRLQQLPERNP